jgi:hypothetical protein
VRRRALPGEVQHWLAQLEALPEARRGPVIAMLSEVVTDCPVCDEVVRRVDRRRLDVEGHLGHLGCIEGTEQ